LAVAYTGGVIFTCLFQHGYRIRVVHVCSTVVCVGLENDHWRNASWRSRYTARLARI